MLRGKYLIFHEDIRMLDFDSVIAEPTPRLLDRSAGRARFRVASSGKAKSMLRGKILK
jgi:hypothetical protein